MSTHWFDPVFNEAHSDVPAPLAARLTRMAADVAAREDVESAIARARIPDPGDLPTAPLRVGALPRGLRIYYEQMHALIAVAALARATEPASFDLAEAPSAAEGRFGFGLGQAFHHGCPLADVSLAAGLPPERIVAIGRRTIRGTGWLTRLGPDA